MKLTGNMLWLLLAGIVITGFIGFNQGWFDFLAITPVEDIEDIEDIPVAPVSGGSSSQDETCVLSPLVTFNGYNALTLDEITDDYFCYREVGGVFWDCRTLGVDVSLSSTDYEVITGINETESSIKYYGQHHTVSIGCVETLTVNEPLYESFEDATPLISLVIHNNDGTVHERADNPQVLVINQSITMGFEVTGIANQSMSNVDCYEKGISSVFAVYYRADEGKSMYNSVTSTLGEQVTCPETEFGVIPYAFVDLWSVGYNKTCFELPPTIGTNSTLFNITFDPTSSLVDSYGSHFVSIYDAQYFINNDNNNTYCGIQDENNNDIGLHVNETVTFAVLPYDQYFENLLTINRYVPLGDLIPANFSATNYFTGEPVADDFVCVSLERTNYVWECHQLNLEYQLYQNGSYYQTVAGNGTTGSANYYGERVSFSVEGNATDRYSGDYVYKTANKTDMSSITMQEDGLVQNWFEYAEAGEKNRLPLSSSTPRTMNITITGDANTTTSNPYCESSTGSGVLVLYYNNTEITSITSTIGEASYCPATKFINDTSELCLDIPIIYGTNTTSFNVTVVGNESLTGDGEIVGMMYDAQNYIQDSGSYSEGYEREGDDLADVGIPIVDQYNFTLYYTLS